MSSRQEEAGTQLGGSCVRQSRDDQLKSHDSCSTGQGMRSLRLSLATLNLKTSLDYVRSRVKTVAKATKQNHQPQNKMCNLEAEVK